MDARQYDSLLDEVREEEREGFVVDTDSAADWCLEQIKRAQAEIERIQRLKKDKVDALEARCAALTSPLANDIAFFTALLEQYARTLDIKPTKAGTRIYKLLNGKLTIKPELYEFVQDAAALVAWMDANGHDDLVQVTRKPMWSELKKRGVKVLSDGTACTTDGEIIEGVTAALRPEKFSVEVV